MLNKSLAGASAKQKAELRTEIENIGRLLQERRISLGITQEKLAEQLDVSYSTIKYIEQGRRIASLPMLLRIASKLKLKLSLEEK